MSERKYVRIHGALDSAKLRTASFAGREYLVVPVVAMVEGVVHGANSVNGPEFVPRKVFSKAPKSWNGEPVTWQHPVVNGEYVSANSPDVLERYAIGRIFNAEVKDNRLVFEAWIDLSTRLREGRAVITRLQAGEMVEISVGAFIISVAMHGQTASGKTYDRQWAEVFPDHLALLPEGFTGACSVEDGCGTRVYAEGELHIEPKEDTGMSVSRREVISRILSALGFKESTLTSAQRDDLVSAMSEETEGFDNQDSDGTCSCGSQSNNLETGDEVNMKLTERVSALIACEDCPFTEDDRTFLAGLSDERLSAFEDTPDEEESEEEEEDVEPDEDDEDDADEEVEDDEESDEEESDEDEAEEDDEEVEDDEEEDDEDVVTLSASEHESLVADAKAFRSVVAEEKLDKVASIYEVTQVFTRKELNAKDNDELDKLVEALVPESEEQIEPTSYAARHLARLERPDAPKAAPRSWDAAREKQSA